MQRILLVHMIQLLGQKQKNKIQDIRREKPAYADPSYRPLPIQTEIPTYLIPKKSDLDSDSLEQDIKIGFEENSLQQEGVISEIYQRPISCIFKNPRIARSSGYGQISAKVFAEPGRNRQNIQNYTKESSKRNTFICDSKRNTCRIFDQPIFQRLIFISFTK